MRPFDSFLFTFRAAAKDGYKVAGEYRPVLIRLLNLPATCRSDGTGTDPYLDVYFRRENYWDTAGRKPAIKNYISGIIIS